MNTDQANAASGDSSVIVAEDYLGVEVLSSYAPFKFGNETWAIIAEMEEEEAFAKVDAMRQSMLVEAAICAIAVLAMGLGVAQCIKAIIKASEQLQAASREIEAASSDGASASQTLADGLASRQLL